MIALSLSRAPARTGPFIPLEEQDPATWDVALIRDGEAMLRRASAFGRPHGRFQLEAAMQSVHADRARTGVVDWAALQSLSSALMAVAPTLGARIAHAAIVGRASSPADGLSLLDELGGDAAGFGPFHAAKADLLVRVGHSDVAREHFERAAELTGDERARKYLRRRGREVE